MYLRLLVKILLITVIPMNSLLLSTDVADVASGSREYPIVAKGTPNPTEFYEHTYSDHFCEQELKVDEVWRLTSNNLFEVEAHEPNVTRFREFTCTGGVIQMLDHETDDKYSAVGFKSWWINSFWNKFVSGDCAATRSGSHRLAPPIPKEIYANLFPCIQIDEIRNVLYDDIHCSSEKFNHIIESRRITSTGPPTCIDVANDLGKRYNTDFVCERNALVEKYFEGHHGCEGAGMDSHHEVIWPYQRWKKWVEGQCTPLYGKLAMKFDKPLFHNSYIDEIYNEIAKTPCGNPMAHINIYIDRSCQEILSTQELVNQDLETDCIHVSSENKRETTRHCINAGQDGVKIDMFDSEDCSGISSSTFYIEMSLYKYLQNGLCVEGKNLVDGAVRYFQMSIDLFKHNFPTLRSCDTTVKSIGGMISSTSDDSLPRKVPQLQNSPRNSFNSDSDMHFPP